MGRLIYLNGEFVESDQARVSVFDHGLLYGDGVFEGIRSYGGNIFKLNEHLERLYMSAQAISLEIGIGIDEMEEIVVQTVKKNGLKDSYIRLVVTRGPGDLGLNPVKCPRPTVFCIADTIKLYPEEFYKNGLEIITASTRRNIPEALSPRIKSLNYLNNIMAKIEANLSGVLEALMLSRDGYVAECTGDNIFVITEENIVITPPPYVGTLTGITRGLIMRLCREKGLEVRESPFTLFEVYNSKECFLTGTAAEVIPVIKVDGRVISSGKPGEITKDLISRFRELTRTEGRKV